MELSNEWKQELNIENFQPFSLKVSLFDLGFYQENSKTYTRVSDSKAKGFELEHKVIVLDTKVYEEKNKLFSCKDFTTTAADKASFAITVPKFDLRNKPLYLTDANKNEIKDLVNPSSVSSLASTYGVQALNSNDFFYAQDKGTKNASGFKVFSKDACMNLSDSSGFDGKGISPVAIDNDNLEGILYLCEEDTLFESKFLTDYSNYKAFKKIALNVESDLYWNLFKEYYNIKINKSPLYSNFISVKNSVVTIDSITEYLLKHCYVLLKCAFFADYVDYLDFSQSLNKSAKVIHNNLILTSKGDYNRYNKFSDSDDENSQDTNPYIPTTTPSIDHTYETLYSSKATSVVDAMTKLIEDAADPMSLIGAVPTQSFEDMDDKNPSFTSSTSAAVPLWFDPDSRKAPEDYGDLPIIFLKDGNLITDGRIISRTIDELWEMIKRLVAGRQSDSKDTAEIGYPRGTQETGTNTSSDTRPAIKKHKFNKGGNKVGDPTVISYSGTDSLAFTIEEWVNDPAKFDLSLMPQLVSLVKSDFPDEEPVAVLEKFDSDLDDLQPASQPYSLRELEGLIRGLQYNVACLAVYARSKFSRAGGGMTQFHKDFDGVKDTSFEAMGVAQIPDSSFFDNKGTSNQDVVPPESAFLSAAGTWQSVGQYMRFRCRTDEDW